MRRTVAIGFLGTVLDQGGRAPHRWKKWRPTISLCMQPDLPIDRLELLHSPDYERLANRVKEDLERTSPNTDVRLTALTIRDPWDFEEVYATLHDFARAYPFDLDHEDYLIHITTGTHVAQICWFLLAEARYLPTNTHPPQTRQTIRAKERSDPAPAGRRSQNIQWSSFRVRPFQFVQPQAVSLDLSRRSDGHS